MEMSRYSRGQARYRAGVGTALARVRWWSGSAHCGARARSVEMWVITHKFTTFNSEFFIYIGLKMNIFMCYYN